MRGAAAFIVAVALVSADDAGPSPAAEAAPPVEAAPAVANVAPPTSSVVNSQVLYQAYNELHALSQQFDTPIHSPAVVVVGRQTDGKSALIEALMGFQFNHVGGGTKTRRPIAMQMHYHPDCELPRCYLQTAAGEQQLSLADLQAHIERENQRLEASKSFEAAEIIVRIEYKYCPNLLIIDTPGLLTPLSRPAGRSADRPDAADASLPPGPTEAAQAQQVEQLVRAKMSSPEHIILCVEETNNWHLAPARRLVMEADPALERTVLVSTKLDTKFAQFGRADELDQFLRAAPLRRAHPALLGGPFFTSVPAGRVGLTKQHVFATNDEYRDALRSREAADVELVSNALRAGSGPAAAAAAAGLGVTRLRLFLEELLKQRYLRNLAYIVPQLQQACARASMQLGEVEQILDELTPEQLRAVCARSALRFTAALEQAVRGSVDPDAKALGQTLAEEQEAGGGALLTAGGAAFGEAEAAAAADGGESSLFGGAQYHRLMREFDASVRALPAIGLLPEDVTNAMGVSAQDDPMHVSRIACAIALSRSAEQLGALVARLFVRLQHVMRRMLLYVVRQEASKLVNQAEEAAEAAASGGGTEAAAAAAARLESLFERQIWSALEDAYRSHLQASARQCQELCQRDLDAVARPPAHVGGGGGGVGSTMAALSPIFLRDGGGTHADRAAVEMRRQRRRALLGSGGGGGALVLGEASGGLDAGTESDAEEDSEAATAWAPAGWYAPSEAVDSLVRRTVGLCRRQLAQATQRKVHSLFLMPFLTELPNVLSASLEACCEPDSMRGFDVREARAAMLARREQLSQEKRRTQQLLRTFLHVRTTLGGAMPSK